MLVIGGGPSGLAAAWAARDAGATVRVVELAEQAGGAGYYAGNYYAVGTDTQDELGVQDSVQDAIDTWADCTGGEGADPRITAFIEGSAENLDWMMRTFGVEVRGLSSDVSTCGMKRVHSIGVPDGYIVTPMIEALSDEIRLLTRAEGLVLSDAGAVVGVRYTDLATGETGWIEAGATVVATGGFARDAARLLEDRPELAEIEHVVEAARTSDGSGLGLLEAVDAAQHNHGAYGLYMHAISDYRDGYEGEALILTGVRYSLIVNGDGARVANEEDTSGFGMFDLLLASEDQRLLALWPQDVFASQDVGVPGYNSDTPDAHESVDSAELVNAGVARIYGTIDDVAAGEGIDLDTLSNTFLRYLDLVEAGEDEDFGKSPDLLESFADKPMIVTELRPGASKAFTGIQTDVDGRVLDSAGAAITGLYASGEVAGMLGTEAVGQGFTGSVNACVWSGRVAGERAAALALTN